MLFNFLVLLIAVCSLSGTLDAQAYGGGSSGGGSSGGGSSGGGSSGGGSSGGGSSGCLNATLPSEIRVSSIQATGYYTPGKPNFLVDVLDALKAATGISYVISARTDLNYSNPDGSFAGTVFQELISNNADLAATDLTITSAREAVVDFLVPFSQYELQLVVNTAFGLGNGVQYLCRQTADLELLKNAKNATLQAIYANIQAGNGIVDTTEAGIAKVLSGNFAYVIESPDADKQLATNPGKLARAGGPLAKSYLALAVQQGSALREKLNVALIKLQEQGVIDDLLRKHIL
ncbi:hypothetical protein BV898_03000 [Hypsibius exemplaris]|uniref:Ionotropic glutamate receptor C-terminal domain-containing protein n=1 Tax=Hypsibius exemplaris TaxID=2072580 RepID=A0A1W0X6F1_HYPEX|nr:hypothetical protein BV898_03000 [Hypsibius exemplaris]